MRLIVIATIIIIIIIIVTIVRVVIICLSSPRLMACEFPGPIQSGWGIRV